MSTARLRLVECREILGGSYDPMRAIWNEHATLKDKRLLLAMAGRVNTEAANLCTKQWETLTGETRAAVHAGLRRWGEWAATLERAES